MGRCSAPIMAGALQAAAGQPPSPRLPMTARRSRRPHAPASAPAWPHTPHRQDLTYPGISRFWYMRPVEHSEAVVLGSGAVCTGMCSCMRFTVQLDASPREETQLCKNTCGRTSPWPPDTCPHEGAQAFSQCSFLASLLHRIPCICCGKS